MISQEWSCEFEFDLFQNFLMDVDFFLSRIDQLFFWVEKRKFFITFLQIPIPLQNCWAIFILPIPVGKMIILKWYAVVITPFIRSVLCCKTRLQGHSYLCNGRHYAVITLSRTCLAHVDVYILLLDRDVNST